MDRYIFRGFLDQDAAHTERASVTVGRLLSLSGRQQLTNDKAITDTTIAEQPNLNVATVASTDKMVPSTDKESRL